MGIRSLDDQRKFKGPDIDGMAVIAGNIDHWQADDRESLNGLDSAGGISRVFAALTVFDREFSCSLEVVSARELTLSGLSVLRG
jgi:hypothetical protein